ncbi:hypothetical protein L6164_032040 [Bauhinia variegata]|uniref:Uncharacterized protein n=1 Tax=Bauhinia variegata TaxID=167791 RepID=A0ACB9KMD8_BAUVA|nr:hypothetical protein L6164_032040 [Bauhinia variegata]
MWKDLKERFSHVNIVQLFNVENEIHNCVQGSLSLSSYFTKLKGLWDERDALCTFPLCTCGSTKEIAAYLDTQKTMKFFMGLNESYASVRSNTLLQDPIPTVNKAYSLVIHHEKQAEATTGKASVQPDAAVFAVKNSGRAFEGEKGEIRQILNALKIKSSSANNVGNHSTHEELSGPSLGEDDWDVN